MVFLIDPGMVKGSKKPCKTYEEPIPCVLCALCKTLCGDVAVPLYGVPDDTI